MSAKAKKISRRQLLSGSAKLAAGGAFAYISSAVLTKPNKVVAAKPGSRIKIGQIGTAHSHARGKMETLRRLTDQYEVVGVVEPDPGLRKAAQKKSAYSGLKWMSEEQLLATKDLQAVAVETTENQLVPTAVRCVKAGQHIHLDKPPGQSLSALKELLDKAKGRGVTVQMGYMFRYNPAFQFCFSAVRKGWLGKIFEVHGVISKTISDERRKRMASKYPGGSMYILGCHLVDALVTVLGRPDRVTPYVKRTRPSQDNLADNMLAVFEYPKASATIRSALMEVDGSKRRQFVVCGDKGTIDIRPLEPPMLRLALAEPCGPYKKGYQQVTLPPMPGRYDEQLIEFSRIVRGEKQPDYSPEHDLVVHETVLGACNIVS